MHGLLSWTAESTEDGANPAPAPYLVTLVLAIWSVFSQLKSTTCQLRIPASLTILEAIRSSVNQKGTRFPLII